MNTSSDHGHTFLGRLQAQGNCDGRGGRVDFGKDPVDAGIVIDVSNQEDAEAMYAGQAFVEVEAPEEEWMGWVDWEQVTGGAGPA